MSKQNQPGTASGVRYARILHEGRAVPATVDQGGAVHLADGAALDAARVHWLPPATGTLFALGLNYADHATELAFKAPTEPLIFIKSPHGMIGHQQATVRPDKVENMHYECELVAVIGRQARRVERDQALDYVAGYTVCNDYAVRDFLENYYRPNLRVKSRDTLTPIGPWITPAADVPDPHALALHTTVNGVLKQQGNTRDMIFDIPFLIEYLSAFMTLQPGDMIATGTPQGLADVRPGDEVVTEVEGVGRLVNRIVSEADYYAGARS
jgi:5-oxopent-3-ene-1,2,5-tricarboxylate decarboxylase/2-hydroxyhepta-2,4-diene-1,7-dioate isomerase